MPLNVECVNFVVLLKSSLLLIQQCVVGYFDQFFGASVFLYVLIVHVEVVCRLLNNFLAHSLIVPFVICLLDILLCNG